MPFFFDGANAKKVTGCIGKLNRVLPSLDLGTIDPNNKLTDIYGKIVRHARKRCSNRFCTGNESLELFIQQVREKCAITV